MYHGTVFCGGVERETAVAFGAGIDIRYVPHSGSANSRIPQDQESDAAAISDPIWGGLWFW